VERICAPCLPSCFLSFHRQYVPILLLIAIVEEIYSDFDCPQEITAFVRYMPMKGSDLKNREQNEARMFDCWKKYLDQAAKQFSKLTA
jgi:hypothetical protein